MEIEAQNTIVHCYYFGKGVAKDKTEAYAWSTIAATSGEAETIKTLNLLVEELTAKEIAAGKIRSKELSLLIDAKKDKK